YSNVAAEPPKGPPPPRELYFGPARRLNIAAISGAAVMRSRPLTAVAGPRHSKCSANRRPLQERSTFVEGARKDLRRHHHRGRPPWADPRRLSCARRSQGAAGGAAAHLRRRPVHARSDAAGLLSQPPFDQSFPHQRNAVVQGFEP